MMETWRCSDETTQKPSSNPSESPTEGTFVMAHRKRMNRSKSKRAFRSGGPHPKNKSRAPMRGGWRL